MTHIPYLHEVVVLFGAALAVMVASYRLRVGPIVGFLMTGVVVGPSGLALIHDTHAVEVFAELGVVFLLFGIGLEISFERLKRLGRLLVVGGGLQVALTVAATVGLALLAGLDTRLAIFLAMVVALSSTAIVMKRYLERQELDAPHGQLATGVLLFQDFLIVPFLLVVPTLAGVAATTGREILWRFGGGLLAVGLAFWAGRLLLPPILKLVVNTEIRELLVIGSLLACLGGALATEALGFSLALGAFLAGILLSESEFHHHVLAETGPFRDVFNSVFFISIGMLVNLEFVAARAPLVLGLALGVLALKGVIVFAVAGILRMALRTRWLAAIGLAQVGELSLLLARSGYRNGLLDDDAYGLVLAVSVLTMLVTPVAITLAPVLFDRLGRGTGRGGAADPEPREPAARRVVIAGFGLNGQHLARVLRTAGASYVVIEASGRKVRDGGKAGHPMLFGDATRPEILRRAGIEDAPVAVFALSDPRATTVAVAAARQLNPGIFIVARGGRMDEIEELREAGANEVVVQEFETSLEILIAVLKRLHVPGNVIRTQARLLRADGYEMLRAPATGGLSATMERALEAGTSDSFQLAAEHAAVGSTLRSLDLRRQTGSTVLAVLRGDRPVEGSVSDLTLEAGDLLVLVGGHAEIDGAFRLLDEKRTG